MSEDLLLDIDLNTLTSSIVNLLQLTEEPKCPEVRFVESAKIQKYVEKSYRAHILPYNQETRQMLRLDETKHQLPSLNNPEDVDQLIRSLDNVTVRTDQQGYTTGTVIQMVTRLLAYSLQFRRCVSAAPTDRLVSVIAAVSDFRSALLDLSNPFTTLMWKTLVDDFLEKAQSILKLPFNPYGDPTGDLQAMVVGTSPFVITGGTIQPLDTNVSFIENLYRQAAGQFRSFEKTTHIAVPLWNFPFKEYVRNRIPMKRVINGAYVCYVDPLKNTYYYTTLTLDPFRFKVLKNLLIYEIVSGKAAYIHSALYFYMSMCTCEEDFQLMIEYGVIKWDFPMEGYTSFCEKMKELLDVMYCWKFSNTYTWHLEMVKIAKWKTKQNDESNWVDFTPSCYVSGLLKTDVAATLFNSLG